MHADQVTTHDDGHVTVTFDTFPIELPKVLDRLVLAQLARRGQASYASHPDHWLFPGGIPGKHLATENIHGQLVERGIQPSAARKAAMFQLAAEIPTPILTDILGLAPKATVRWAALAARELEPVHRNATPRWPRDARTRTPAKRLGNGHTIRACASFSVVLGAQRPNGRRTAKRTPGPMNRGCAVVHLKCTVKPH
jgi:hypothetical protein